MRAPRSRGPDVREWPGWLTASTFSATRCRRLGPGGGQMVEEPLHVVFGTGQVGLSAWRRLAASGTAVRAVSRHCPAALADGVDSAGGGRHRPRGHRRRWVAKGATVVYQCLNAPYTQLSLRRGTQRAEGGRTRRRPPGDSGEPLRLRPDRRQTDDRRPPAGGDDVQGPVVAMAATGSGCTGSVASAADRTSRPGVTESTLGTRVFGNAVAGKRADFIGNPELPATYSSCPTSLPA